MNPFSLNNQIPQSHLHPSCVAEDNVEIHLALILPLLAPEFGDYRYVLEVLYNDRNWTQNLKHFRGALDPLINIARGVKFSPIHYPSSLFIILILAFYSIMNLQSEGYIVVICQFCDFREGGNVIRKNE